MAAGLTAITGRSHQGWCFSKTDNGIDFLYSWQTQLFSRKLSLKIIITYLSSHIEQCLGIIASCVPTRKHRSTAVSNPSASKSVSHNRRLQLRAMAGECLPWAESLLQNNQNRELQQTNNNSYTIPWDPRNYRPVVESRFGQGTYYDPIDYTNDLKAGRGRVEYWDKMDNRWPLRHW
jgi:hypothetical protein